MVLVTRPPVFRLDQVEATDIGFHKEVDAAILYQCYSMARRVCELIFNESLEYFRKDQLKLSKFQLLRAHLHPLSATVP